MSSSPTSMSSVSGGALASVVLGLAALRQLLLTSSTVSVGLTHFGSGKDVVVPLTTSQVKIDIKNLGVDMNEKIILGEQTSCVQSLHRRHVTISF